MDIPYSSDAMKGMRAIVCGASKGIGRATAEMMASIGAEVIGLSRSAPEIPGVKSLKIDLEDENEIQLTISKILDTGPVHILVNNAGGPPGGPLLSNDSQHLMLHSNVTCLLHIKSQEWLFPQWKKRGLDEL